MKIGVDLDGVVVDFDAGWVSAYNEWFGARVRLDWRKPGDPVLNETHFETRAEFWAWADAVPTFWTAMPSIPGALGAIYDFKRHGHDVCFITARHEKARLPTQTWLGVNGLGWADLHMTRDKWLVDRHVYIDDNPDLIQGLLMRQLAAVRFKQPWNRDAPGVCADGWGEVRRIVKHMATVELEAA